MAARRLGVGWPFHHAPNPYEVGLLASFSHLSRAELDTPFVVQHLNAHFYDLTGCKIRSPMDKNGHFVLDILTSNSKATYAFLYFLWAATKTMRSV